MTGELTLKIKSIFVHRWRTKQNLDFSFLMLYAQNKGTYYVQVNIKIKIYVCN